MDKDTVEIVVTENETITDNAETILDVAVEATEVIKEQANETVRLAADLAKEMSGDDLGAPILEILHTINGKLDAAISRLDGLDSKVDLLTTIEITQEIQPEPTPEIESEIQPEVVQEIEVSAGDDSEVHVEVEPEPRTKPKKSRSWL